jgi:hypothetical protein
MINLDSVLKENRAPLKPFEMIIKEDKYYVMFFYLGGFALAFVGMVLLVIITRYDCSIIRLLSTNHLKTRGGLFDGHVLQLFFR